MAAKMLLQAPPARASAPAAGRSLSASRRAAAPPARPAAGFSARRISTPPSVLTQRPRAPITRSAEVGAVETEESALSPEAIEKLRSASPQENYDTIMDCLQQLEQFDYPPTEVKLFLMMATKPTRVIPKFLMQRQVDTFMEAFVMEKPLEQVQDTEALTVIRESVETLLEAQIRERSNTAMTSDALDDFDIDDRTKAKVAGAIEKIAVKSIEFSLWNAVILTVVALGVFNMLMLSGHR